MIPFLNFEEDFLTTEDLLFLAGASGAKGVEDTATGNPVTFETDLARPLKSLVANFLPIQSGTGDPSPTNIRPITGWTGLDVWHGGKNLLNPSLFSSASENYSVFDDVVTVKKSDDRAWGSVSEYELPAGRYTISRSNVQGRMTIKSSTDNYNVVIVNTLDASATFTLSQKCAIKIKLSGSTATYPYDTTLQIEVGQTATTYEPYSGTVYPVTWQTHGTIYGGYVDLVTGEVWGTWNGIQKKWSEGNNPTDMGEGITRKMFSMVDNLQTGLAKNLCNVAPYKSNENAETHFYYSGSGATGINARVFLPTETDGDTDIVIITNVSVPILITTITPQQITALIGNNTVWSDGNGDCEVTYLKKG